MDRFGQKESVVGGDITQARHEAKETARLKRQSWPIDYRTSNASL